MAKRAHWTTEEVLEEILSDEEPVVELQQDWGEIEDGRDRLDRDEPCMEGSDEEFSDLEDLQEEEGNTGNFSVNT